MADSQGDKDKQIAELQARNADLDTRLAKLLGNADLSRREMKALTTALAHYLSTPLMEAQMYLGILSPKDPDFDTNLEIIRQGIDGAIAAKTRFTDYLGEQYYLFVNYDVHELIDTVLAERKLENVTKQYCPNGSLDIDCTLIKEAIRAILDNAVRESQGQGNIHIETKLEEVYDAQKKADIRYMVITISNPGELLDNGPKPFVVEADIDDIFLPGYTRDSGQLFGMGLTFARKYVNGHNGKIRAYNEDKAGEKRAVIEIMLPVKQDVEERHV